MKAILINPERREVTGIEIQPHELSAAFGNKKVLLAQKMMGHAFVLCHDVTQSSISAKPFWIEGVQSIIFGKGLLLGREAGKWPVSIMVNVRDVECLVRFGSSR